MRVVAEHRMSKRARRLLTARGGEPWMAHMRYALRVAAVESGDRVCRDLNQAHPTHDALRGASQ